jgi:hypothetical protein
MTTSCDLVAQCVAFGEPLGALAEHVADCARCQRMVDMPGLLAGTRHDVDPGMGFSARMTVGARQLVAARHRRRIAAGLAAMVATGAIGVFVMTRSPADPTPSPVVRTPRIEDNKTGTDPKVPTPAVQPNDPGAVDPDVATLVHYANSDLNRRLSAKWTRIEQPLAPYRKLLQGVKP